MLVHDRLIDSGNAIERITVRKGLKDAPDPLALPQNGGSTFPKRLSIFPEKNCYEWCYEEYIYAAGVALRHDFGVVGFSRLSIAAACTDHCINFAQSTSSNGVSEALQGLDIKHCLVWMQWTLA